MTNQTEALAERLQDEADLCRSEGAIDIAGLLDEAAAAIREATQPKCPRHGIYLCGSCMRSAALSSQPPAPSPKEEMLSQPDLYEVLRGSGYLTSNQASELAYTILRRASLTGTASTGGKE